MPRAADCLHPTVCVDCSYFIKPANAPAFTSLRSSRFAWVISPKPRLDRAQSTLSTRVRPATSWTRLKLTRGLRVKHHCFHRPRLRMTMSRSLSLLTDRLSSMATVSGHDNPFRWRHKVLATSASPFVNSILNKLHTFHITSIPCESCARVRDIRLQPCVRLCQIN